MEVLTRLEQEELAISVFVACELLTGAALSKMPMKEKKRVLRLLEGVEIIYPEKLFPGTYANVLAQMSRIGNRVATMDLLIGVTALLSGAPLVTRNQRDFGRIPGLEVLSY